MDANPVCSQLDREIRRKTVTTTLGKTTETTEGYLTRSRSSLFFRLLPMGPLNMWGSESHLFVIANPICVPKDLLITTSFFLHGEEMAETEENGTVVGAEESDAGTAFQG